MKFATAGCPAINISAPTLQASAQIEIKEKNLIVKSDSDTVETQRVEST